MKLNEQQDALLDEFVRKLEMRRIPIERFVNTPATRIALQFLFEGKITEEKFWGIVDKIKIINNW